VKKFSNCSKRRTQSASRANIDISDWFVDESFTTDVLEYFRLITSLTLKLLNEKSNPKW